MPAKPPVRSLQQLVRRQRQLCTCKDNARAFSSTTIRPQEQEIQQERPRWSYTPQAMKAPFQPRIKDPTKAWEANEDPGKLDAVYVRMLGTRGDQLLSDETKWLAVTHKSFDQGRRGFNDRLAYFGKRLLLLQAQISLLNAPNPKLPSLDPYDRTPTTHQNESGLPNLSGLSVNEMFSKERLSALAKSYGIDGVVRWKPRNPQNMEASGCDVVYATTLYAVVGAIALENGGKVANEVIREKVLKPLGI